MSLGALRTSLFHRIVAYLGKNGMASFTIPRKFPDLKKRPEVSPVKSGKSA
jgi:hypothetical protein